MSVTIDLSCDKRVMGSRDFYALAQQVKYHGVPLGIQSIKMALRGHVTRAMSRHPGNGPHFESARQIAMNLLAARERGESWPQLTVQQVLVAKHHQSDPQTATTTMSEARKRDIEENGYDYFDVGWPAVDPPKGDGSAIEQIYFHLHHTKGLINELTARLTALEAQNPTTTPGTQPTANLLKLAENNSALADENAQLRARNAALEQNATWMEAQLEKREEELVEAGKDAAVRLRRALLEQAAVFATTLKAILPA